MKICHVTWLGVVVLMCGVFQTEAMFPNVCGSQVNGTEFSSEDGCYTCICINGKQTCTQNSCPMLICHESLVEDAGNECCPRCKPGCYDEDLGFIEPGGSTASKDKCFSCECSRESQLLCMHIDCPICPGHWSDDGNCCGHCDMNKCVVEGQVYKNGDQVDTDNKCETCTCVADGDQVQLLCYQMACSECRGKWIDDGTCCGKCEVVMCNVDGKQYNYGDVLEDDDPCTDCICIETDEGPDIQCVSMACEPCPGISTDDGSCCGKCEPGCFANDKMYKIGEVLEDDDPCSECFCSETDEGPDFQCAMMSCFPCRGKHTADGTCCGKCEPGCLWENEAYEIGEVLEDDDPCSECICSETEEGADFICAMMACYPCPGKHTADGTCCGKCEPGCIVENVAYEIGMEVPSKSPCEICSCVMGESDPIVECRLIACAIKCPDFQVLVKDDQSCCGHCEDVMVPLPDCATVRCAEPRCPVKSQFTPIGSCCPECKCRYKRQLINPGPFGNPCDGCVCNNGKVTCNPPKCPDKVLECVDAVIGEDCCYHCPNGKTCAVTKVKGKVLKYGEIAKVKGDYCTCAGEPWYPVAFCTKSRVPKSLLKKFGNQVADPMKLD